MTVITLKHLGRVAPVLAALVIAMGSAKPASAEQCAQDLVGCYQQAATLDGFWQRAAAGLDCEFSYAGCVCWTF
jgi:hypothetical protein